MDENKNTDAESVVGAARRRQSARLGHAALWAAVFASPAQALQFDWLVKAQAGGMVDLGRDLGQDTTPDRRELSAELDPWAHLQIDDHWEGFARARLFAPTDAVAPGGNGTAPDVQTKAFAGVDELWLGYGTLAGYPGAWLRAGRQRVREEDTEWFDQYLDAVNFNFDTTLLKASLGVANSFNSWRTDNVPLPAQQRDRLYGFGRLYAEWLPYRGIGLRAAHAEDHGTLPQPGATLDADPKLEDASLTWIGLESDGGLYDRLGGPPFAYALQANWLTGDRSTAVASGREVTAITPRTAVSAWAAELAVRQRVSSDFPLQLGAALATSSGGGLNGEHQYEQTGAQSNYARYTGTPTLIDRYNGAYRAELGNLSVATVFASWTLPDPTLAFPRYDLSAIAQTFRRRDGNAPVVTDGVNAMPLTDSKTLGNGYDLVLTRYFTQRRPQPAYSVDRYEDLHASIRLRASMFQPGSAYGSERENHYRIALEGTVWF